MRFLFFEPKSETPLKFTGLIFRLARTHFESGNNVVIDYHFLTRFASMPAVKFTKEQLDTVRGLLHLGYDSVAVGRKMKANGVIISTRYIRTIRAKMKKDPAKEPQKKKRGPKFKLNPRQSIECKAAEISHQAYSQQNSSRNDTQGFAGMAEANFASL